MALVLLVEDDWPIVVVIADELADAGHHVDVVDNGADALVRLKEKQPDIVVLDLMLPVMNGWEFVEQYRDAIGGVELPIVVVSAARAVTRSMEARGVQRFLSKPFDLRQLRQAIDEVA